MKGLILGKFDVWFNFLKDVFFPLFCIGCKREGTLFCENCINSGFASMRSGFFCCPVCARETECGVVCGQCREKSSLDSMMSLVRYTENSLVAKLLHEFKYNYVEAAQSSFENIFAYFFNKKEFFLEFGFYAEFDAIVSVPLHARRFAKRGFNQSDMFSHLLSLQFGVPVVRLLKRNVFTRPQVGLSHEDRQKNVLSAFTCSSSHLLVGKRILLVDDVFTTGSTMQECARTLKAAGAAEVHGFTFARTSSY